MKPQVASATKLIHAPAEKIYKIIADYRNMHPLILPKPYFLSLHLEEGGFGEGTIVSFTMRLLGQTRSFRALISEPEPGRVLQETDADSGVATRFAVISLENNERAAWKQYCGVLFGPHASAKSLSRGIGLAC
jgi:hypothetical protein